MKKITLVIILALMGQFVFSQSEVMKFLSKGYNTQQDLLKGFDADVFKINYFYGYEDYSEAFIYNDHLELSTGNPGTFYPYGGLSFSVSSFEYKRYNGQNNSIGYYFSLPSVGYFGEEHKFENNRLVYWALTEETGQAYITAEKIEQDNQGITITTRHSVDGSNFPRKYYNIPRAELLDLYLTKYVELICTLNEMVNKNKNVNELYSTIRPYIQGRTARELAIFRNCLYAIKGYRFSTASWADFFNKYLKGYTARYTNDQVTAMFTENEKWLLDLVMRYESRQ